MTPDYIVEMEKLAAEWPSEKLREFTLNYLRESCVWAAERRNGLEIANAEQRRLGVPYSERKRTTGQIEALHGLFLKWRDRGVRFKNHPPKLSDFVQPEDFMYIHSLGFEWHLKTALLY